MKTISSQLQAHLASSLTTLATCWKVTRQDGVVMGFTDHMTNLVIGGVTYLGASGFTASAAAAAADLSVDNLEVTGMISSAAILDTDIYRGVYDMALIQIFIVNWQDLTMGQVNIRSGLLGQVTLNGQQFVAELRGKTQYLQQNLAALYSAECRANLGDAKCGVNLAPYTFSGSVVTVSTRRIFTINISKPDYYFINAYLTWTSGGNNGLKCQVLWNAGTSVYLWLPVAVNAIAPGDAFTITAGCDKKFSTCQGTFNNAVNFRGEPYVPVQDDVLMTPSVS